MGKICLDSSEVLVENGQTFRKIGAQLRAARAFLSLLTIPAVSNQVPENTRLEPVY